MRRQSTIRLKTPTLSDYITIPLRFISHSWLVLVCGFLCVLFYGVCAGIYILFCMCVNVNIYVLFSVSFGHFVLLKSAFFRFFVAHRHFTHTHN